jgi:diadenosine tetraphosphatase ApaH/serine/threonine PP2A family protein phosphatase
MRYIIFSDLHSNLEALNQFEKEIKTITHDKLVCLGDIIGYGADPNPCVEWVMRNVDFSVAGNHDWAAVNKTSTSCFNLSAYESSQWTRLKLTEENKKFLCSLSLNHEEGGVYWVHASPHNPKAWHYVTSKSRGELNFKSFEASICFVGHTHKPIILEQTPDGEVKDYVSDIWSIKQKNRYIINVGSLGQPRDGNPDAAFMVYDSEERIVEVHRFEYNLSTTQHKIRENGLHSESAERLAQGR